MEAWTTLFGRGSETPLRSRARRNWSPFFLSALALGLMACSHSNYDDAMRDLSAREVTLPNGKTIYAEVMMRPADMLRGMMFRDSLPADHGMLFVHGGPGKYPYWMHNVKIPLDIIWMDPQRRVVEISENTPPCKENSALACPNYGGKENAQFVLELNGGGAAKNGIIVGSRIEF